MFARPQPFDEVLFLVLRNCENQSLLRKCQSYKNVRILVTIERWGEAKAEVRYKDTVISFELKWAEHRNATGLVKTDVPRSWILFYHSEYPFTYEGAQAITERLFRVLHPDTTLRVDFLAHEARIQECCRDFPNAFRSSGIWIGKPLVTGEELQYVVEMFTNLRAFNLTSRFPASYAGLLDRYSRLEEAEAQDSL
ncbi:hypothetical protein CAEBREN_04598 [Caenorhabditis brenneri]|uniref:Uncharacterized protein n=1 Tax=Caenorhabditis brenneri TaxID=135651 RepID=G0ND63_CAEBE|nr:hypothetical protein CAEBREN_04598 [Caenorhabditis brenneri]